MNKSKILKDSIIYLGTSVLNKALPFFLLPLLTRYLSRSEYGILAIFQVFLTFMTPFVGLSLQLNISKNFFKVSKKEMAELISNMMIILFTNVVIILVLVGIIISFFDNVFGLPNKWLMILPVLVSMNMLNQFYLTIQRNKRRAFLYGFFEISKTILSLGLTIILVVVFKFGWEGRAWAIFGAAFAFGFMGILFIFKQQYLRLSFQKKAIIDILKISLPLIPHVLAGAIIVMSDRLFIDKLVSKEAVGIYAVGYMFGMIVSLFSDAFIKSWSPWFYQNMSSSNRAMKQLIVKYSYLYAVGIFFLTAGIIVVSHLIFPIMVDKAFWGAKKFIFLISTGYAVHALYQIIFPYFVYAGRTRFLAAITCFSAGINLIANYFLIKMNGAIGAAQATVIAFSIMFIGSFLAANRISPMPWFKVSKI